MAASLVGQSAVQTGASGAALATSWTAANGSFPLNPGDTLLLWVWGQAGAPSAWTVTAGWTQVQRSGVRQQPAIYSKQAVGGDTAPTVSLQAGVTISGMLGEFTGLLASPLDRTNQNGGTGIGLTVTNPAADVLAGELFVYCSTALFSASVTRSPTISGTNGTANTTTNAGSTGTVFYNAGFSITDTAAAADACTNTLDSATSLTGQEMAIASFQITPVKVFAPGRMPLGA